MSRFGFIYKWVWNVELMINFFTHFLRKQADLVIMRFLQLKTNTPFPKLFSCHFVLTWNRRDTYLSGQPFLKYTVALAGFLDKKLNHIPTTRYIYVPADCWCMQELLASWRSELLGTLSSQDGNAKEDFA